MNKPTELISAEKENAKLIDKIDWLANQGAIQHEKYRDEVTLNEQLRADITVKDEALKLLLKSYPIRPADESFCIKVLSQSPGTELLKELEELRKDKERLDWLEKQSDGSSCIARQSNTGRGFRLHNTGEDSSYWSLARNTFRAALDVQRKEKGEKC